MITVYNCSDGYVKLKISYTCCLFKDYKNSNSRIRSEINTSTIDSVGLFGYLIFYSVLIVGIEILFIFPGFFCLE